MGIDVSVVMTLHSEGFIVHRTFRALQAAIGLARKQGLSFEVVAVLDKVSDPILKNTVEKWSSILDGIVSTHEVDFGALSLARNFGISNSKGEFISILDGDDLYGENWLYSAHQVCAKDHRTIAHPEAFFSFPFEPFLRLLNKDELTYLDLMNHNKWPALLMAHRDIFTRIPYIKDDQTFAYQDWLWNCETAAKGYRHVLAPRTLMAIRQKRQGKSLWQNSDALNKVVRSNSLFQKFFNMQYEPERKIIQGRKKKNPITGLVRDLMTPWIKFSIDYLQLNYKSLFDNLIFLKRSALSAARKILKTASYAEWICEELSKLSRLEPTLNKYTAAQIRSAPNTFNLFCAIDSNMAKLVQEENARVYIAESLESNSIILNLLFYLHTIEGPSYVVTTERSRNPWKRFLPEGSIHVDIGNTNLFFEEKLRLFHRLLLETNTTYLHLFGSRLALEMLNRYPGTFVNRNVYTSIPGMEMTASQEQLATKINFYDDVLDCFTKISTNSHSLKNQLLKLYGLFDEQVVHHRYSFAPHLTSPILASEGIAFQNNNNVVITDSTLNILWIGKKRSFQYKKITKELTQDLNEIKVTLKTRFWNCLGFLSGEAASGFRKFGPQIKRFVKIFNKNVITYDIVIVEIYSDHLLLFLTQCIGFKVPVFILDGEVPRELKDASPLWISTNPSTRETIINMISNSRDFEIENAKSKQHVECRHTWIDFKKEVSDFYCETGF